MDMGSCGRRSRETCQAGGDGTVGGNITEVDEERQYHGSRRREAKPWKQTEGESKWEGVGKPQGGVYVYWGRKGDGPEEGRGEGSGGSKPKCLKINPYLV